MKVLHIAKRTSARQAICAPVSTLRAWRPMRPPMARSSADRAESSQRADRGARASGATAMRVRLSIIQSLVSKHGAWRRQLDPTNAIACFADLDKTVTTSGRGEPSLG